MQDLLDYFHLSIYHLIIMHLRVSKYSILLQVVKCLNAVLLCIGVQLPCLLYYCSVQSDRLLAC